MTVASSVMVSNSGLKRERGLKNRQVRQEEGDWRTRRLNDGTVSLLKK